MGDDGATESLDVQPPTFSTHGLRESDQHDHDLASGYTREMGVAFYHHLPTTVGARLTSGDIRDGTPAESTRLSRRQHHPRRPHHDDFASAHSRNGSGLLPTTTSDSTSAHLASEQYDYVPRPEIRDGRWDCSRTMLLSPPVQQRHHDQHHNDMASAHTRATSHSRQPPPPNDDGQPDTTTMPDIREGLHNDAQLATTTRAPGYPREATRAHAQRACSRRQSSGRRGGTSAMAEKATATSSGSLTERLEHQAKR